MSIFNIFKTSLVPDEEAINIHFVNTFGYDSKLLLEIYKRQTPGSKGTWQGLKGVSTPEAAHYIIGMDGLDKRYPSKVEIVLQREPLAMKPFVPIDGAINITHKNFFNPATWLIERNFDFLNKLTPKKKKKISFVVSGKAETSGQSQRLWFAKELSRQHPGIIDFYGLKQSADNFSPGDFKGSVPDKFEALEDYEYSVGIESALEENYVTEKIYDLFLSRCVPIYHGTDSANKLFNTNAFHRISLDQNGIDKIMKILQDPNDYREKKPLVEVEAKKILTKYNLWPSIKTIIEGLKK